MSPRCPRIRPLLFCALATTTALACGGGTRSSRTADDTDTHESRSERRSGIAASAEIGALDQNAVTRTFSAALKDLKTCLDTGARRVELLGGEIAFYVEVDASGHAQHVHAERSTLGDRDTERCMIDALKNRPWPAVQGGEKGLARNSFDFDMPNDVRPPVDWDADQVSEALGEIRDKLSSCGSRRSDLTATVYVNTDGRAIAAGVAGTDPSTEDAADCVAAALQEAQYPSPGSWPAKVTFRL
jgi:hypothetical protein